MVGIKANKKIETAIKRHFGLALLATLSPVIFIKIIGHFAQSSNTDSLLILVSPISVLGGCALLLKRVLDDIYSADETNA
ncbi:hypothetical protein [Alteromonas gilva]|uniref:Uncharacterized protein n=1 Tax=Alteromonas gilva TaxID=2987522 RepID=A0ABT5L0P3_9ALTE|nr:hypothetical protein [Alteromonas gilva]MDC8830614.1 hypothetical protein [Alteromonas gilva]